MFLSSCRGCTSLLPFKCIILLTSRLGVGCSLYPAPEVSEAAPHLQLPTVPGLHLKAASQGSTPTLCWVVHGPPDWPSLFVYWQRHGIMACGCRQSAEPFTAPWCFGSMLMHRGSTS